MKTSKCVYHEESSFSHHVNNTISFPPESLESTVRYGFLLSAMDSQCRLLLFGERPLGYSSVVRQTTALHHSRNAYLALAVNRVIFFRPSLFTRGVLPIVGLGTMQRSRLSSTYCGPLLVSIMRDQISHESRANHQR